MNPILSCTNSCPFELFIRLASSEEMPSEIRDVEANLEGVELDIISVNEPLLDRSTKSSLRSTRRRRSLQVVTLDDIPPVIKSANGNIIWADEQCTRRIGLTTTEARLLLSLLTCSCSTSPFSEPTFYTNYSDYISMFHSFSLESSRLRSLVADIKWWHFDRQRKKKIWVERIKWLERMEEPRLWVVYLMARRRRILRVGCKRVLGALREKRRKSLRGEQDREEGEGQGQAPEHDQDVLPLTVTNGIEVEGEFSLPEFSKYELSTLNEAISNDSVAAQFKTTTSHLTQALRSSLDSHGLAHHNTEAHSPPHSFHFHPGAAATLPSIAHQIQKFMPNTPYIVVGWFRRCTSDPKERILQFEKPEDLFRVLRRGERDIRGWRRWVSLKGLRGYGLYKCDIPHGAHLPLTLTTSQTSILSQFFLAYKASSRHADAAVATAWHGWVHTNLNAGKQNPLEGRYSLELVYEWSSYRLCVAVGVPLVLSLVLGVTKVTGDVMVAWSIAMYVVTAAAAVIALLAIIGGLNDM
ncbi:hypothetical protein B0J14DRAFT_574752 [Halenospora varia]|nr:hypothetical protein B0J14DRAFT_574752 [Halenospora varia]